MRAASSTGCIIALSLIAVVYIGFVALVQHDMKKLIAYSSIAHMGFVTLGAFLVYDILAATGIAAGRRHGHRRRDGADDFARPRSRAHCSCASACMYDRVHSREISAYGGVINTMPKFAAFMVLFALANSGLPGTSGFVGEFLVILAAFKANFWYALLAGTHADPRRGLHAVAGQARDLRSGGQPSRRGAAGPQLPRVLRARIAGRRRAARSACGPRRCSTSCRSRSQHLVEQISLASKLPL